MLGDVLKSKISSLINASKNKISPNAFWKMLRDIAKEEIIEYGSPIDSDQIIPIYYEILQRNTQYIPDYFKVILPSNNQERYRVVLRNLFSSNAFHPDGLANQHGIVAKKEINESKKGYRIVFQKR